MRHGVLGAEGRGLGETQKKRSWGEKKGGRGPLAAEERRNGDSLMGIQNLRRIIILKRVGMVGRGKGRNDNERGLLGYGGYF